MSDDRIPYQELQEQLQRAEATLSALRRGEVDLVIGETQPLVVRFKDLVEEKDRLLQETDRLAKEWQTTFNSVGDAIWILDAEQRVLHSNKATEHILHCSAQEVAGKHCWEVIHGTTKPIPNCPLLRTKKSLQRESLELQLGERWLKVTVDPIVDADNQFTGAVHIVSDITGRKQTEAALQNSLQEKTQLIRELYHRTKNNMQVIMSMLMLQAEFTEDEQTRDMLQGTNSRIHAMALVHEKLYQSQNLSRINLNEYIQDLAQLLAQTYRVTPNKITLAFDLEPIPVLIDIAVPCGLVLNELISNALKHAFPHKQSGEISIRLRRAPDNELIILTIADNGIGMPRNFNYGRSETFGLQTIVAIVEHQLQGKIVFEEKNGLTCRMQFKDSHYEARV